MTWYNGKEWYGLDGTQIHHVVKDLCNACTERRRVLQLSDLNFTVNLDRTAETQTIGAKQGLLDEEDLLGLEFNVLAGTVKAVATGLLACATPRKKFGFDSTLGYLKSGSLTGQYIEDFWTEDEILEEIGAMPSVLAGDFYDVSLWGMVEGMLWITELAARLQYYAFTLTVSVLDDYNDPDYITEGPGTSCTVGVNPAEVVNFSFERTYYHPHKFHDYPYTCPYSYFKSAQDAWDSAGVPARAAGYGSLSTGNTFGPRWISASQARVFRNWGFLPSNVSPVGYWDVVYHVRGGTRFEYRFTPDWDNIPGTPIANYFAYTLSSSGLRSLTFSLGGNEITQTVATPIINFTSPNPMGTSDYGYVELDLGTFNKDSVTDLTLTCPKTEDNPFVGQYNYGYRELFFWPVGDDPYLFWSGVLRADGIGDFSFFPFGEIVSLSSRVKPKIKLRGDFEYEPGV